MIGVQQQQVLIPKQVYIGDSAELRCTFNYSSQNLRELTQNGTAKLPFAGFQQELNYQDYEIKSVDISPAGVDYYQFTITFVPWKTGEIIFPDYSLNDITLKFEPVNIVSLTEQQSISTIQETTAPLLLPGTTYKLYALLIFVVLFLIAFVRLIIHHNEFIFFLKNLKLKIKYKKNASVTRKKLTALLSSDDATTKQVASDIQNIMRNYLEVRFAYPFTRCVTSELMKGFDEATRGLLSEEKELAFEGFVAAFVRTDYLRYASQNEFEPDEKKRIVEELIANINIIETPAKEEKDNV